jgi:hypothetical protein
MEYYIIIQILDNGGDIIHAISLDEEDARQIYNDLKVSNKSLVCYSVDTRGRVVSETQILWS